MLVHEMESLLRNVDARLARVEQILPTLALQETVHANHRHMLILHQDVKGDFRLLAEHLSGQMERLSDVSERLSGLSERVSGLAERFSGMSERLSEMSDILRRLDRGR